MRGVSRIEFALMGSQKESVNQTLKKIYVVDGSSGNDFSVSDIDTDDLI